MADQIAKLRRALGALSMELGHFETALGCAVAFLANPKEPRVGMVLVAELSLNARLALFSALWIERVPNAAEDAQLKAFRRAVHTAAEARNTLIHSIYWPGNSHEERATRMKVTAKEKHGLRLQLEEINEETVANLAESLTLLTEGLDGLIAKFFADQYQDYLARYYSILSGE